VHTDDPYSFFARLVTRDEPWFDYHTPEKIPKQLQQKERWSQVGVHSPKRPVCCVCQEVKMVMAMVRWI
jgi:hypothetical protein